MDEQFNEDMTTTNEFKYSTVIYWIDVLIKTLSSELEQALDNNETERGDFLIMALGTLRSSKRQISDIYAINDRWGYDEVHYFSNYAKTAN